MPSSGSSPLARGTPTVSSQPCRGSRLIPARAGNTGMLPAGCEGVSAHPRSRGEHFLITVSAAPRSGSSPLARGTRLVCSDILIMPMAHPRSRGEHNRLLNAWMHGDGSSPLARGTPYSNRQRLFRVRLIPARAGNTDWPTELPGEPAAHPRSRGEHRSQNVIDTLEVGSSPLARGTHLLTWGFTPYISKIESLWSQSLHPEYTINNRS